MIENDTEKPENKIITLAVIFIFRAAIINGRVPAVFTVAMFAAWMRRASLKKPDGTPYRTPPETILGNYDEKRPKQSPMTPKLLTSWTGKDGVRRYRFTEAGMLADPTPARNHEPRRKNSNVRLLRPRLSSAIGSVRTKKKAVA